MRKKYFKEPVKIDLVRIDPSCKCESKTFDSYKSIVTKVAASTRVFTLSDVTKVNPFDTRAELQRYVKCASVRVRKRSRSVSLSLSLSAW